MGATVSRPYGPTLARLRLSSQLRSLRGERPAAGVAKAMHWSLSKLNRIENGKVTIQPIEVQALARHFGVTDPDEVELLVQLSITSRQRSWWRDKDLPEDFLTFVSLESDASEMWGFQATFIPPLLQTRAYAEAITASALIKRTSDDRVQQIVQLRMRRQAILHERLESDHPPTLVQVIDESVLLRPVGGVEIIRDQIDHLVSLAEIENVQIVVIPLRYGSHPGLAGAFELLKFPGADDLDVAFIETPGEDFLITDEESTRIFTEIINNLSSSDPDRTSLASAADRARKWHSATP
jgi:uncharacterized protein DUF5753/helix-turn-helix protein